MSRAGDSVTPADRAVPAEREVEAYLVHLTHRAWGLSFGLLFGAALFVLTAVLVLKGGERPGQHLVLLANYFPGYRVTWAGACVGFVYAFVVGFATGRLVAWVYDRAARREMAASPPLSPDDTLVRLSGNSWGLSIGALFGLGLFLATSILVLKGGEEPGKHLIVLAQYFPGYAISFGGALLGALYSFVVGYAVGWVLSLVYNATVRR